MKIYIAGPMRGYKFFNFPAFDSARDRLSNSFEVVSPADLDREAGWDFSKFPEDSNWEEPPEGFSVPEAFARDLQNLCRCDIIHLLPGWEMSRGALVEVSVAGLLGMSISVDGRGLCSFNDLKIEESQPKSVLFEAASLVVGDRSQSYGAPWDDFARTATMWQAIFSRLLRDGAVIEPRHVALAQIAVKLSREVNSPKRDNWVDIAGYAQCGSLCDEVDRKQVMDELSNG